MADVPNPKVELTYRDCQVLILALHDLRTLDGERGWDHPAVARLRGKVAAAITEALEQAA